MVGSSNIDMVVMTDRIPLPGETVMGNKFVMAGGGKGANQAVAAARLCADVTFVARLGSDVFGDQSIEKLSNEDIDCRFVTRDAETPSGVALIFVDGNAENCIVVAPGANETLKPEHVVQAKGTIEGADVLITQFEVPLETVAEAVEIAHAAGVKVILNPAPARELPKELLSMVDVLTPNETEAAILAGMEPSDAIDPEKVGRKLLDLGVGAVVMTLGSKGALIVTNDGAEMVPSQKVEPVDTTAAGDAFNGGLAVALAEGRSLTDAARFGAKAAAIAVTRVGAQPSLATRAEVDAIA